MHSVARIEPVLGLQSWPPSLAWGWAASCRSALEVGGDFYDVVALSPTRLLIVIADVMGKGPAAALFADSLRTLVRGLALPNSCPADLLSEVNRLMYGELSRAELFITAQVVTADWHTRQLQVASAGHCPLLLSDQHGRLGSIAPAGLPLGIQLDSGFRDESALLPSFGSILLYTDGVTDARDSQGRFFGQERLMSWLGRNAANGRSAVQLKADLLQELADFQGWSQAADDQTFVLLSSPASPQLEREPDRGHFSVSLQPTVLGE